MKALHVIPSVAPRYGGPSRAVIEMCRALIARGVETLMATTDANGEGRLDVRIGEIVSFEDVPSIFFPRQASEAFKYSRPLARWLRDHVADFDVVHIHAVYSHACLAAARACRKKGVPYIVRPLGSLDPWSLRQKPLRKKLFWPFGVRRMLERAAAIHYTTEAEKKSVEESLGLGRGVVIPLGIETKLLNHEERSGQNSGSSSLPCASPYVLVLSRLHQKKGLEILLQAFLSLVRQPEFAHWKLILAGEGATKYVDSLKRLVKTHSGNGNVIFAGWLDGARRNETLREASLLALTSHQENFGLCAVEAMACGVPVLLSPQVNLSADVEKAQAGWISPLDCRELETILAESFRDENERVRRGERGKEFVRQNFASNAVASALVDLYTRIASNGSGNIEGEHA